MMELREPPRPASPAHRGNLRGFLLANLALLLALAALVYWRTSSPLAQPGADAEDLRQVASKLMAAGALDEAAGLYEDYLAQSQADPETRAKVAYRVGTTYLERGAYEKALRWFYEAETQGPKSLGALSQELDRKIVHSLERMGRFHAAQAALSSRVRLETPRQDGQDGQDGQDEDAPNDDNDPVVARIGAEEFRRSHVQRALDDLPPQVAQSIASEAQRQEFLRRFIAEELLWRKAKKLEYDNDPEVRRQHALLLKQMAVAKFVEVEVVGKIVVDETDLRTFFQANQERYEQQEGARLRLIQVASEGEAREIQTRLAAGESFAELARARSAHPPTRNGGGLVERWVSRGENFLGVDSPEEVTEAVFATPPGQTTAPIAAGGSFYLFRIEERRPAQSPSFDEVRPLVEQQYRRAKMETAYNSTIESELSTEDVELFAERMGEL